MFLVPHKKVMAFKPTRQILWDPYTFGVYLLLNTLGVVNGAILANAAVALFPPVCKLLWCRRHFLALQPRPFPLSSAACSLPHNILQTLVQAQSTSYGNLRTRDEAELAAML